jgi:broad specificity phosphatase PhoE
MSQFPIELIVTSQLERAKETAQIVLQNHDSSIPVLEIEDLAEISWGSLEGTPTKGVSDVLEEWRRGSFDGNYSHLLIFLSDPLINKEYSQLTEW